MTGIEAGEELSEFVRSFTTLIDLRIARYAEEFDPPGVAGPQRRERATSWQHERELLEDFETLARWTIARYEPPGIRRRNESLVFQHVYSQARRVPAPAGEVPVGLLAALLAAEVEFRGPLRLSTAQDGMLAGTYEGLGRELTAAGLPAHAAFAFGRGRSLHRQLGSAADADRCGLAEARARRLASPPGLRRALGRLPDLVCGYGYRPFRILGLIAVQLALFTGLVTWVTGAPLSRNLYLCLTDYLSPLGLDQSAGPARPLYVIEAYLGTISLSVFFALMVRRWFRL